MLPSASGLCRLHDKPAKMLQRPRRPRRVAGRNEPFLFSLSRSRVSRWVRSGLLFRNAESSPASPGLPVLLQPSHCLCSAFPLVSTLAAAVHLNTRAHFQTISSQPNSWHGRNPTTDLPTHPLPSRRRDPRGTCGGIPPAPAKQRHKPEDS